VDIDNCEYLQFELLIILSTISIVDI